MPGLRLIALRYWRSRVTRGYVAWRRANVPLPAGKQLVQYRWESKDGGARPVYEWVATGRRRYQCEWKVARASTEGRATVEAGFDAVHRCADATWFEWPKGSVASSRRKISGENTGSSWCSRSLSIKLSEKKM